MNEQVCLDFDGATYERERDGDRLGAQMKAVRDLMLSGDGAWRTLPHIAAWVGYPEASVSARLRDLRKTKFGAYNVERRYVANGLWEYRVKA